MLFGFYRSHVGQGRVRAAAEASQELLALAQRQPGMGALVEGHLAVGGAALFRGDFAAAQAHLELSWSLANALPFSLRGGFVAGVEPLLWLQLALWALGYADQAQRRSQEALARARQADHPPSLWLAECFAGMFSQCCRDTAGTRAYAEASLALATMQGFTHRVELSRILQGWALVLQGDAAADITDMHQEVVGSHGQGPEVAYPYWLTLLAEAYGQVGQPEDGLAVLGEALAVVATTEARWWEADIYRLRGDLLLQLPSPDVSEAETSFHQALDLARRQQTKAFELRGAMSLGRLWQSQGKREEACQLMGGIYGRFAEGFDTADLQTAKALLEEFD